MESRETWDNRNNMGAQTYAGQTLTDVIYCLMGGNRSELNWPLYVEAGIMAVQIMWQDRSLLTEAGESHDENSTKSSVMPVLRHDNYLWR